MSSFVCNLLEFLLLNYPLFQAWSQFWYLLCRKSFILGNITWVTSLSPWLIQLYYYIMNSTSSNCSLSCKRIFLFYWCNSDPHIRVIWCTLFCSLPLESTPLFTWQLKPKANLLAKLFRQQIFCHIVWNNFFLRL